MITKKKILFFFLILFVLIFVLAWNVVSGGYDRQNKIILFFKEIIPPKIYKKARDVIFIIPDLKERNKFLTRQVDKFEQGLEGKLFNKDVVISTNKKKKYELKEFYLPFQRLDLRLGWHGEKNSRRAHHFEFFQDKVIVISGEGQTIYFNKNNILKKKLNQKNIPNNIIKILNKNNFELIGIRDLFIEDNQVYFTMLVRNSEKLTIKVYRSDLSFENLNFQLFYEVNEYWQGYNVYSGGRLSNFKNNKILLSIGYNAVPSAAQSLESNFGKIFAIDKDTAKAELISYGHRNPQGLIYIENENIIINTEHGPKGGDEININFLDKYTLPNYGWDIASYGTNYDGTDESYNAEHEGPYEKSHEEFGFIEPFKYFVPSIGISQLVYMPNELNKDSEKYLFVSSLRAGSVYLIKIDDEFNKILDEDRLMFLDQRIRDIKYDEENKVFFLIFEVTPSIATLKELID